MTDVAVVGLGTAGSAVAALCAARGLSVVGIDADPLESAGARWVNGVPGWAFDAAGIARPTEPELRSGTTTFHLVAGWGPTRVTVDSVLEVDMRHLSARLQQDARRGDARLAGRVRVTGFGPEGLETSQGRITARCYVDASGLSGVRLLGQARPPAADLCTASQYVHPVVDRPAAAAFFAEHGADLGDVLCFTGVAGGYSIVNIRVDGEHAGLLTGSLPAGGHPSGKALADAFASAHPWLGPAAFGGSRAIPLSRPHACVGRDQVALIGDAACQVHAAHGSGIAQQLLAARVLADALAGGGGPAAYNVEWQRRYGAVLAGADLFRRFSSHLQPAQIDAMVGRGVLSPPLMGDALLQKPPRPPLRAVARAARGLVRLPSVARGLAPVLARMRALEVLYRRYPADAAALPRWERRLERLSGVPSLR